MSRLIMQILVIIFITVFSCSVTLEVWAHK